MITGLASSFVAITCLGCTAPRHDGDEIRLDVGPVVDNQRFDSAGLTPDVDPNFESLGAPTSQFPLRAGSDFAPNRFAQPETAAQFRALDLSTPLALRAKPGETLNAEVSFGASAQRTGLGLDFELAQRAQIDTNRAGNNVSRVGSEVRLGQNLDDRDQRGTRIKAPSWYFFIGSDNEALVWNLADDQSLEGVALRDQVTVGDLQAGVAWSTPMGGQMSVGLVERELSYSDRTGENDIKMKEQFAAFSFTLNR